MLITFFVQQLWDHSRFGLELEVSSAMYGTEVFWSNSGLLYYAGAVFYTSDCSAARSMGAVHPGFWAGQLYIGHKSTFGRPIWMVQGPDCISNTTRHLFPATSCSISRDWKKLNIFEITVVKMISGRATIAQKSKSIILRQPLKLASKKSILGSSGAPSCLHYR